jgi:hypothetical protein
VPDARQLVLRHPSLLVRDLPRMLADLALVGFSEPQLCRMVQWYPRLLSVPVERAVLPMLAALRDIGVRAPCDVLARAPTLLDLSIERSIRPKVQALRALGYRDVGAMVQRCPRLLTLSLDDNLLAKHAFVSKYVPPHAQTGLHALERCPRVLDASLARTIAPTAALLDAEFGPEAAARMLMRVPALLQFAPGRLRAKIAALALALGSEDEARAVLAAAPFALQNSVTRLSERAAKRMGMPERSLSSMLTMSERKLHGVEVTRAAMKTPRKTSPRTRARKDQKQK